MAARKKAARKASATRASTKRAAKGRGALTVRQSRFVDEYQVDGNGTHAAIRAGYAPKNADVTAAHLLVEPKVARAIAEDEAKRSQRCQYDADQALRDLLPLCGTNIKNFIAGETLASVKDIGELPDEIAAQITSIKTIEKRDPFGNPVIETEFKLHDRVKAIQLAGRHKAVQAWSDRVEVSHSLLDRMAAIRAEAAE